MNGTAYDERYDSVAVDVSVKGKQIEAQQLLVKLHGMQVTGDGGYNLATEQLHAHISRVTICAFRSSTWSKSRTCLSMEY